jgi:monoamine oxidase
MKFRLKSIGVLLFSLSVFTGCFKWGSRAYDRFPETIALDKNYFYEGKVIIVGAGASGLAAAKILERNHINYEIIEATGRYGGRLQKDTLLADFPMDLGAEWIHNQPGILNKLIGLPGDWTSEELIPYHLESAFSWDGQDYAQTEKEELDAFFNFFPEYKFKNSTWFDYVDENFAQHVKHKIRFNTPISEIDFSGNHVILTAKNGEEYVADKVLVTVSIGVLKSNMITFNPALSNKKERAINRVDFLPGFKLVMKFSEKFYPDAITFDSDSGDHGYYDMAFKKESDNYILTLLSTGGSPKEYFDVETDEEIVSAALLELDEIFNGTASNTFTGEYELRNWGNEEYILGTWTNAALNKNFNLNALNEPLENKVYFAGEINDANRQMGVPGAILSGYFAINELLDE